MFNLEKVHEYVSHLRVDPDQLMGQPLNQERYDWYIERFEWLLSDGLPDAINCYLEKLKEDPYCNDYTRLQIICVGTTIMNEAATLKFDTL